MPQTIPQQPASAISKEFAARLERLGAKQKVRAIVLLQTGSTGAPDEQIPLRQRRREIVEQIQQISRAVLPTVDQILEDHAGRRLSSDVDALGSITVEATAEGIKALATSEHVKAVLEDQAISNIS